MSGMERQPSSALSFALLRSTISGLMTTSGSPSISITASRSVRPTCGAASPIPRAWCIVSNMSATRRRISSVTFVTGVVAWRRIGSPRTRMSRMLTVPRSLLRGGRARAADDARDLAALDDEAGLRRLDRDLVLHRPRRRAFAGDRLPDVHDLADDAAGGDDPVAALDGAQCLLVLLPLLLLRTDEEEVEDAQDQYDLDQEGRQRACAAATELEERERGENARVHH